MHICRKEGCCIILVDGSTVYRSRTTAVSLSFPLTMFLKSCSAVPPPRALDETFQPQKGPSIIEGAKLAPTRWQDLPTSSPEELNAF